MSGPIRHVRSIFFFLMYDFFPPVYCSLILLSSHRVRPVLKDQQAKLGLWAPRGLLESLELRAYVASRGLWYAFGNSDIVQIAA